MGNLGVIKRTYEGKTSEENGKNLEAHLAPDVRCTVATGFPYTGTYIGFEAISTHIFDRLATEWIDYRFIPEDYMTENSRIAVVGTYKGTYRKTSKSFSARVVHIWCLKDGEIINFEQFVDSKTVVDAMS